MKELVKGLKFVWSDMLTSDEKFAVVFMAVIIFLLGCLAGY
ncbi:hypothetical protein SAMN05192545_3931 [Maribacter dokdonensis]|uniref:TMhelix containing protein n=1 Tax=Maribacter dokdonensis TaxID=320912 RepID=A0ABY0TXT7_9FLAO|nr:hypothetical protein SAMN05192545_0003 [Maribacter dokdonensis]SDT47371.1 hypothetical protein SAMN05192545_3931 [Maribacter dokdonensis]